MAIATDNVVSYAATTWCAAEGSNSNSTSVATTASPPPSSQALAPRPRPVRELWYDDGNLVLEAEGRHFKIFGGLLAARSSVFRDMLAFPPPPEGNPTIDGCPVVHVYDSAADLNYFLRAVFDSSFFEPPPTPTTLPTLSAVLRLSLKYDVPFLSRRGFAHLATTFPTSLADWRQRDARRTIPPLENTPFVALRLARECGAEWLIPSIAYCVCSHPFDKTLEGAVVTWAERTLEEDDGSSSSSSSNDSSSAASSSSSASSVSSTSSAASDSESESDAESDASSADLLDKLYTGKRKQKLVLSWPDKRTIIIGRQKLLTMQSQTALAVLKAAAPPLPPPPPPQMAETSPSTPSASSSASDFFSHDVSAAPSPASAPAGTPAIPGAPAPVNIPVGGPATPAAAGVHVAGIGIPINITNGAAPPAPVQAPVPIPINNVAPAPIPGVFNVPITGAATTPGSLPGTPGLTYPFFATTPSTSPANSPSGSTTSALTYDLSALLLTHCPTPASCALTRLRCADTLVRWDMAGMLDYFADNTDVYRSGFCAACRGLFEEVCRVEAGRMWSALPAVFGLAGESGVDEQAAQPVQGHGQAGQVLEDVPEGWRMVEMERRRAMAE